MNNSYCEILPHDELKDVVHSFWNHRNLTEKPEQVTIIPDSYLKIVVYAQEEKVVSYFMTGLWTEPKVVSLPAKGSVFGCRLNILAPEYLLGHEVQSIVQSMKQLDLSFLNLRAFDLGNFQKVVEQWQKELLKIKPRKAIAPQKARLSQLLYKANGLISAAEVAAQIFWTQRQINRYLNQYVGVSLKQYLNIQKVYFAYQQIREGRFFPENEGYYDQAHFIREVKKHTGETPSSLFKNQNDQFIQFKNMLHR